MLIKTNGIVLGKVKHSDNSLIVRVFTREAGVLSFYVRSSSKSKNKKHNLFQYFSIIEMEVMKKENQSIHQIKEMSLHKTSLLSHSDVVRSSMLLFLCEVVHRSIQDDYQNAELFDFLVDVVELLNQDIPLKNFHIWFLIELSKWYGFSPEPAEAMGRTCFDLLKGEFVYDTAGNHVVRNKEVIAVFNSMLGMILDDILNFSIPSKLRGDLLDMLIQYFHYQIEGMGEVKSHLILKEVFE